VVPTAVVQPATVAQPVRHPQLDFKFTINDALATLQNFSGGSDKSRDALDDGTFIAFQDWFSASTWELTAAGVPLNTHAAIMAQKPIGTIQKLFIRDQAASQVDLASTTTEELRARLPRFYHDATLRFTHKVVNMRFRKDFLAQDLSKFRVYATYSNCASALDGNDYI
jgi:hypothetical protein